MRNSVPVQVIIAGASASISSWQTGPTASSATSSTEGHLVNYSWRHDHVELSVYEGI